MESLIDNLGNLNLKKNNLDISKSIDEVSKLIKTHITDPSIEIEVRLGIYDEDAKKFGSNIGEEHYNNIKNLLDSGINWKKKNNSKTTDYMYKKMRLSISENGEQRCIEKKKNC